MAGWGIGDPTPQPFWHGSARVYRTPLYAKFPLGSRRREHPLTALEELAGQREPSVSVRSSRKFIPATTCCSALSANTMVVRDPGRLWQAHAPPDGRRRLPGGLDGHDEPAALHGAALARAAAERRSCALPALFRSERRIFGRSRARRATRSGCTLAGCACRHAVQPFYSPAALAVAASFRSRA